MMLSNLKNNSKIQLNVVKFLYVMQFPKLASVSHICIKKHVKYSMC